MHSLTCMSVVVCVVRKPRPCNSYSRRRDRINSVLWRSSYKGGGGNIVWICPLAPGTSADVLIWDREGPKRSKGHYMDYEIGSMDGAYKGRLHVAWSFIGRKTLTE